MVCIVSVKEGAHGVISIGTDSGSLFRTRALYCQAAAVFLGLSCEPVAGSHCPLGVLELAAEAFSAERQALALLARAEQFRQGLHIKLLKRKLHQWAVTAALDFLTSLDYLDDTRYACSWIRQRVRHHAEGPRSLAAALARRGVDGSCSRRALAETFTGALRRQALGLASRKLGAKGRDRDNLRFRLKALGYGSEEILAVLDEPDELDGAGTMPGSS